MWKKFKEAISFWYHIFLSLWYYQWFIICTLPSFLISVLLEKESMASAEHVAVNHFLFLFFFSKWIATSLTEVCIIRKMRRAHNHCCHPWSKGSLDIKPGISIYIRKTFYLFSFFLFSPSFWNYQPHVTAWSFCTETSWHKA